MGNSHKKVKPITADNAAETAANNAAETVANNAAETVANNAAETVADNAAETVANNAAETVTNNAAETVTYNEDIDAKIDAANKNGIEDMIIEDMIIEDKIVEKKNTEYNYMKEYIMDNNKIIGMDYGEILKKFDEKKVFDLDPKQKKFDEWMKKLNENAENEYKNLRNNMDNFSVETTHAEFKLN